jgi:hypothetical protein
MGSMTCKKKGNCKVVEARCGGGNDEEESGGD